MISIGNGRITRTRNGKMISTRNGKRKIGCLRVQKNGKKHQNRSKHRERTMDLTWTIKGINFRES